MGALERESMQVGGVRIGMAWGWISTITLLTLNAVSRNIIAKHRHSARCKPAWQMNSEFAEMMVRVVGEGEGEWSGSWRHVGGCGGAPWAAQPLTCNRDALHSEPLRGATWHWRNWACATQQQHCSELWRRRWRTARCLYAETAIALCCSSPTETAGTTTEPPMLPLKGSFFKDMCT